MLSKQEYEAALEAIGRGRVVEIGGRTAWNREGLDFIARAEGLERAGDPGAELLAELKALTVPELRQLAGHFGIRPLPETEGLLIQALVE